MKKITLILCIILFSLNAYGQNNKTFCDLVENYTKDAKKVYLGEVLMTVPEGYELWIDMRPIAHQRNQGENGGCRLVAGEKYVARESTAEPIRAYKCGNPIKPGAILYRLVNQTNTITRINDYSLDKRRDINTSTSNLIWSSGGGNRNTKLQGNLYSDLKQVPQDPIYNLNNNVLWYPKLPYLLTFGKKFYMGKGWSFTADIATAGALYGLYKGGQAIFSKNGSSGKPNTPNSPDPGYNPGSK